MVGWIDGPEKWFMFFMEKGFCAEPGREPVTVRIIHGDPVVGQALTLLLEGSSYQVEAVTQSFLEEPAERIRLLGKDVRLFIFAFDLDAGCSERILRWLKSRPETVDIPVIVLGVPSWDPALTADYHVPWPIRTEELRSQIQEILAAPSGITSGGRPVSE